MDPDNLSARKLEELIDYPPRPYTDLEIEITTRCNLFCPGCPRSIYRRSWIDQDMSLAYFERLLPTFEHFRTVHFRGWGEPLLNPFFPEMVRLAYQSGARLVLSTNGVQAPNPDLLPYFDAVTIRLDYGRATTYEKRNPGAKFNRALYNVSQILLRRDGYGSGRPRVAVLFAKNKYSLKELPVYMETAARLRPDRVVFYRPFFHFRKVDAQSQLPGDAAPEVVRKVDDRLEAMARDEGIEIVNQRGDLASPLRPNCVFDPEKGLFVNWSGRAALCRFSALPVAHGVYTRFYPDREEVQDTTFLGNLVQADLEDIVRSRVYRRGRLACRLKAGRPLTNGEAGTDADHELGKVIHLHQAPSKTGFCFPR